MMDNRCNLQVIIDKYMDVDPSIIRSIFIKKLLMADRRQGNAAFGAASRAEEDRCYAALTAFLVFLDTGIRPPTTFGIEPDHFDAFLRQLTRTDGLAPEEEIAPDEGEEEDAQRASYPESEKKPLSEA
jgi:hypothetical protein